MPLHIDVVKTRCGCVLKPLGLFDCVCIVSNLYGFIHTTRSTIFFFFPSTVNYLLTCHSTNPGSEPHAHLTGLLRRGSAVEVAKPQRTGDCRAMRQRFSISPMSDYLGAPVIIQCDLNLPATLWFDGSAHSLGVGLPHVKHRQIMIGLSVAFTKVKDCRYECDVHWLCPISAVTLIPR